MKSVAIVGKAPASIPEAPFDDQTVEIWSLSDNYRQIPRWDRWFELHDVDWHREQNPAHWDFLRADHGKPLYILHPHKDLPHALVFPRDKIFSQFPADKFFQRYMTNSVSWFIALAIVEGFDHIGIYGVDMAQHEEYAHQRPSCEYWIGVANGLGVTVHIPGTSDLMKCNKLYGYETHSGEMYRKLRARDAELSERIGQAEKAKAEAEQQTQIYYGCLQALDNLSEFNGEVGAKVSVLRREFENRMKQCAAVRDECEKRTYVLQGAKDDLQWARQWC